MLEIIPALIIGLAVACTVVLLGRRIFVGSESASDQVYQREPPISASGNSLATADVLKAAVDEPATAPLLEDQRVKPPKKTRKHSAVRSKENAGEPSSRPGRRKTKNVTVPGAEVGTPAVNGQSAGPAADLR